MNLALRLSKRQMLFIVFMIIVLIATTLLVIHTAMPSFWHTVVDSPNIMTGRH